MSINRIINFLIVLSITTMLFTACSKNQEEVIASGSINFTFSETSGLANQLKSKPDAKAIFVTIQSSTGTVLFNKFRLELVNFNGKFITQSIAIPVSSYQITEFFVVNANNSVIYTTPLKGSPLAYLVKNPLPMNFTITKDNVSAIVPEVLSTDCSCSSTQFGYLSFDFNIVSPICFLANVQVYDSLKTNWVLTNATILIKGDTSTVFNGSISAKTDSIKVRDGYTNYTISVSKVGYVKKDTIVSVLALKSYLTKPITITLKPNNSDVIDVDGNIYKTVSIGNQIWLKENLRTTHYRDGSAIPNGLNVGDYSAQTTPKYFFTYGPNPVDIRGLLYTWYTINDSKNICPIGWHIPSESEWATLTSYLGGNSIAGGALKETGFAHWLSPNMGATNSSGFNALGTGYRYAAGTNAVDGNGRGFGYLNESAAWWCANSQNVSQSNMLHLTNVSKDVNILLENKINGHPVRCIKD